MLLIIDQKPRRAESYADSFYWMGVLAIHHKPIEALSKISPAVGAILIVEPSTLPDTKEYISRIRALCRTVPIFALSEAPLEDPSLFSAVFSTKGFTSTYLSRMRDICAKEGLRPVGVYRLSGMDISCTEDALRYKKQSVRITKTEAMILRYLFLSYPARVSAHHILAHAYRHDKCPDHGAVRAHICALNQKLSAILGYRAIDNARGEGYRMVTPPMPSLI